MGTFWNVYALGYVYMSSFLIGSVDFSPAFRPWTNVPHRVAVSRLWLAKAMSLFSRADWRRRCLYGTLCKCKQA